VNDSDKAEFKSLLDGLADYYRQDKLGKIALQIYFSALHDYSIEQVSNAASAHLADTKSGQYYPKAADLIKQIDGGNISPDMIIAAAKLHNTPLGCLARIHIGTWDLDHQDAFYLRQRATECLELLQTWKEKAKFGDYTDHELSVMIKYNVDPTQPLLHGLAKADDKNQLITRVSAIKKSERHLKFIDKHDYTSNSENTVVDPDIKNQIAILTKNITIKRS